MKKWIPILLLVLSNMSIAQSDLLPRYKYQVSKVSISENIEIAYVDEGDREAPVLLMVHGLGGYVKNWYPTIDELSSDYRCIALDLPGYGLSTIRDFQEEDYLEFFSNAVQVFVEKLDLKEVTLLGHSMGGQVSIVTALKEPDWLRTLILAAPAGFETFTEQEGALLKNFASAQVLMNHNETQIRAAYQANFVSMPPMVEELIQDRLKAKEADWFEAYAVVREMGVRGMLEHPVNASLEKITIPTYVVFGENDLLIPNKYLHPTLTIDQVAEIGKKIPNVKIEMIESAGHMLQMDRPESFNRIVKQILTN